MSNKPSLKDVSIFTIQLIAPGRSDLVDAIHNGSAPNATILFNNGDRITNAVSRAEYIAREFHKINILKDGDMKEQKKNDLMKTILGTHLPLHYPECIDLIRWLELGQIIEDYSLRFVSGELSFEEYHAVLSGEK